MSKRPPRLAVSPVPLADLSEYSPRARDRVDETPRLGSSASPSSPTISRDMTDFATSIPPLGLAENGMIRRDTMPRIALTPLAKENVNKPQRMISLPVEPSYYPIIEKNEGYPWLLFVLGLCLGFLINCVALLLIPFINVERRHSRSFYCCGIFIGSVTQIALLIAFYVQGHKSFRA